MPQEISNTKDIEINAPATAVWRTLTKPELIRKYFFGVDTEGDWAEGNTVASKGEWKGKKFQGKSKVLRVVPGSLLQYNYWSDLSGHPDKPENYHKITYQLKEENGHTKLTLTEENLATEEMKQQSSKLWDQILGGLKETAEELNEN